MYDVGWQKALVVRDKQGGLQKTGEGKKIIRKKQEADGGKEAKWRETVVYGE